VNLQLASINPVNGIAVIATRMHGEFLRLLFLQVH